MLKTSSLGLRQPSCKGHHARKGDIYNEFILRNLQDILRVSLQIYLPISTPFKKGFSLKLRDEPAYYFTEA